ncbi:MAG: hypothetical protein JXB03_03820 [Spirochaetales bacterium]|nr:hypothetical protein [Spirochaetales bacterium]
MKREYGYLSACGVEIELMTVEAGTLSAVPWAKSVLDAFEQSTSLHEAGVDISNELVQHVLEIKTSPPPVSPWAARDGWAGGMKEITGFMAGKGYGLLGTGMHPWFDPETETRLWAWEDAEIYQWYHKVFNCYRHGFANLQSIHLNIPFQTDAEFAVLHAAVRALLPLLPGLCASTPFRETALSGMLDTRIDVYRNNQNRFPVIAGAVIPEPLYSEDAYHDGVFKPLEALIRTLPESSIIESQWLNSRGAIARFDRGSIEIRLMDTQECLDADLAVAQLVFASVVRLCGLDSGTHVKLQNLSTPRLVDILNGAVFEGDGYVVDDEEFLSLLGFPAASGGIPVRDLWQRLYHDALADGTMNKDAGEVLVSYFTKGCLSARIIDACDGNYSAASQKNVYRKLYDCEMENRVFP